MREVRDAMAAILDKKTLADICETVQLLYQEEEDRESLMFYI